MTDLPPPESPAPSFLRVVLRGMPLEVDVNHVTGGDVVDMVANVGYTPMDLLAVVGAGHADLPHLCAIVWLWRWVLGEQQSYRDTLDGIRYGDVSMGGG